jgi:ADP-heptose:LPS heptosyltransferase
VPLNPATFRIVRATKWLSDAVMSLPAIRAIRSAFPDAVHAHLTVLGRLSLAGLRTSPDAAVRLF